MAILGPGPHGSSPDSQLSRMKPPMGNEGGVFPLPPEKGNVSKRIPENENTEKSKKTVSKVRGISK